VGSIYIYICVCVYIYMYIYIYICIYIYRTLPTCGNARYIHIYIYMYIYRTLPTCGNARLQRGGIGERAARRCRRSCTEVGHPRQGTRQTRLRRDGMMCGREAVGPPVVLLKTELAFLSLVGTVRKCLCGRRKSSCRSGVGSHYLVVGISDGGL
jgi:hypothetical protein